MPYMLPPTVTVATLLLFIASTNVVDAYRHSYPFVDKVNSNGDYFFYHTRNNIVSSPPFYEYTTIKMDPVYRELFLSQHNSWNPFPEVQFIFASYESGDESYARLAFLDNYVPLVFSNSSSEEKLTQYEEESLIRARENLEKYTSISTYRATKLKSPTRMKSEALFQISGKRHYHSTLELEIEEGVVSTFCWYDLGNSENIALCESRCSAGIEKPPYDLDLIVDTVLKDFLSTYCLNNFSVSVKSNDNLAKTSWTPTTPSPFCFWSDPTLYCYNPDSGYMHVRWQSETQYAPAEFIVTSVSAVHGHEKYPVHMDVYEDKFASIVFDDGSWLYFSTPTDYSKIDSPSAPLPTVDTLPLVSKTDTRVAAKQVAVIDASTFAVLEDGTGMLYCYDSYTFEQRSAKTMSQGSIESIAVDRNLKSIFATLSPSMINIVMPFDVCSNDDEEILYTGGILGEILPEYYLGLHDSINVSGSKWAEISSFGSSSNSNILSPFPINPLYWKGLIESNDQNLNGSLSVATGAPGGWWAISTSTNWNYLFVNNSLVIAVHKNKNGKWNSPTVWTDGKTFAGISVSNPGTSGTLVTVIYPDFIDFEVGSDFTLGTVKNSLVFGSGRVFTPPINQWEVRASKGLELVGMFVSEMESTPLSGIVDETTSIAYGSGDSSGNGNVIFATQNKLMAISMYNSKAKTTNKPGMFTTPSPDAKVTPYGVDGSDFTEIVWETVFVSDRNSSGSQMDVVWSGKVAFFPDDKTAFGPKGLFEIKPRLWNLIGNTRTWKLWGGVSTQSQGNSGTVLFATDGIVVCRSYPSSNGESQPVVSEWVCDKDDSEQSPMAVRTWEDTVYYSDILRGDEKGVRWMGTQHQLSSGCVWWEDADDDVDFLHRSRCVPSLSSPVSVAPLSHGFIQSMMWIMLDGTSEYPGDVLDHVLWDPITGDVVSALSALPAQLSSEFSSLPVSSIGLNPVVMQWHPTFYFSLVIIPQLKSVVLCDLYNPDNSQYATFSTYPKFPSEEHDIEFVQGGVVTANKTHLSLWKYDSYNFVLKWYDDVACDNCWIQSSPDANGVFVKSNSLPLHYRSVLTFKFGQNYTLLEKDPSIVDLTDAYEFWVHSDPVWQYLYPFVNAPSVKTTTLVSWWDDGVPSTQQGSTAKPAKSKDAWLKADTELYVGMGIGGFYVLVSAFIFYRCYKTTKNGGVELKNPVQTKPALRITPVGTNKMV